MYLLNKHFNLASKMGIQHQAEIGLIQLRTRGKGALILKDELYLLEIDIHIDNNMYEIQDTSEIISQHAPTDTHSIHLPPTENKSFLDQAHDSSIKTKALSIGHPMKQFNIDHHNNLDQTSTRD